MCNYTLKHNSWIICTISKQEILSKAEKRNQKIRENPNNIKFSDFVNCIESNGFLLDRVSGSHHFFIHSHIETPINMQKKKDDTTKGYQVKQAIKIIDGD